MNIKTVTVEDIEWAYGSNPCNEIILRPQAFCNLTEAVVRAEDTLETLKEKVRKATILGTLQASLTDFRYLRKSWRDNTEEEALLGVSLTGIMDNEILSGRMDYLAGTEELPHILSQLRRVAIETNKEWAQRLGINPATAITCVKPSGTVSQLVNSASGIHPRFSDFYIRRVRGDAKDPLSQFLVDAGVPTEDDRDAPGTLVHSFPIASPKGAITADSLGALDQLKLWKVYQDHWCEHKPSITVYYTDDDFLECCQWLWENFDDVSGVAFLPLAEHSYSQAPYEAIDEAEYNRMTKEMPVIDWEAFDAYESEDATTGSQELACTGNSCEIP